MITPSHDDAKRDAVRQALAHVQDGMTVGLGTGSTATLLIEPLARQVHALGWRLRCLASSVLTEQKARAAGLQVLSPQQITAIDVVIDGADEVSPAGALIKGGGGALLREKLLATRAKKFVVVVDESKLVSTLGAFPLPVEVVPFGQAFVANALAEHGISTRIRHAADGTPFVTDNGNHILDCTTGPIDAPGELAARLDHVVGLVEHGLFVGLTPIVCVGRSPQAIV